MAELRSKRGAAQAADPPPPPACDSAGVYLGMSIADFEWRPAPPEQVQKSAEEKAQRAGH